jgi:hypothetical protein
MLVVVPREEVPAESAAIFDAPEAVGEIGPVLHRLELRLREWVVSGDKGRFKRFPNCGLNALNSLSAAKPPGELDCMPRLRVPLSMMS